MRTRKLIAGLAAVALFGATMPANAAGNDAGAGTGGGTVTVLTVVGLAALTLGVIGIADSGKSP